ncbi:hypothetical protein [Streptomyces sp. FZ201]|uniref:hypothetical protein n=1 Tax=Streptomyces sp. FZ201 TaxID=3057122 RepID=UPI0021BEAECF|nr:hypothetical protein [Streptomyces sp. FZ201]
MSTQPESTPPRSPSVVRLLPFSGPEGKRAHLITDGTPTMLSLLADNIENQQIEAAAVIVSLARPMVEDTASLTTAELRWITRRLIESLTDVLNICESRGQRIPDYVEPERPDAETDGAE